MVACFVTQVPSEQLKRGVLMENKTHEPLGFASRPIGGPGDEGGTTTQVVEDVDRIVAGGERRPWARVRRGTYRHRGNPRLPRGLYALFREPPP